jgi:hypothetical protein
MTTKANSLRSFIKKIKSAKRGQIFLVCTVIIVIYLLSFISIVFELNKTQYSQTIEINNMNNAFENFKTETGDYMKGMLANYSLPATLIDSNVTAATFLQAWLDFAEKQMVSNGYMAIFEIDQITPINPIEVVQVNGRMSIEAYIDVLLASNYLTIDTQLSYYFSYETTYVNTVTNGYITLTLDDGANINNLGYAEVTVNGGTTVNLYNGTYVYSAPLGAGDVIECTTIEQIIVTRTV